MHLDFSVPVVTTAPEHNFEGISIGTTVDENKTPVYVLNGCHNGTITQRIGFPQADLPQVIEALLFVSRDAAPLNE